MVLLRRNLSVDLFEASQGRGLQPGEYVKIPADNPLAPVLWALDCCPTCGEVWAIGKHRHHVAVDGTVTPSLVCPRPNGCSFHDFVKLEGWEL